MNLKTQVFSAKQSARFNELFPKGVKYGKYSGTPQWGGSPRDWQDDACGTGADANRVRYNR